MTIDVSVVFAQAGSIWQQAIRLPRGSTIADALKGSGFFSDWPQLEHGNLVAGVYGQTFSLDHVLLDGDRVEIYRPLVFDPNESRRRRAAHRKNASGKRS